MIGQRKNKFTVAVSREYKKTDGTIVFKVSFFVGNPVGRNK